MRSVIGALLHQGSRGLLARVEVRPLAHFAHATGVTGAERLASTVRWGHDQSGGSYAGTAALDWSERPVPHGRQ
ncbi:MAG TPA: hypothetical protein VF778_11385, partial [Xanthobacteraceae bacterium]